MHCLVYTSSASRLMSDAELSGLLETCRRRNVENGVTGCLLYKDGSFMQALEGPSDAVRETYDRIARDSRHRDLFILFDRPVEARSFGDWSMGFRAASAAAIAGTPGFADLAGDGFAAPGLTDKPHRALKLLRRFHENTR